jgi:[ribosomal protein S5]-alanine N-acetyltransferase
MKTLVTQRLIIRPLKTSDLDAFNAYSKKPNIGPMAGWKPHETLEESYRILLMMIKEEEVWGITLKSKDEMIGTIGLHVRTFDNAIKNQKELGYVLDDLYWGMGLMKEAGEAILKYAFQMIELDRVVVGHSTDNNQSKRVIEKLNFKYTHTEERDHFDHTKKSILMYELRKEDYIDDKLKNKI